jgi:hypothetical protein
MPNPPPVYIATVPVTITKFLPMTSGVYGADPGTQKQCIQGQCIQATFGAIQTAQPTVFSATGKSITISLPRPYPCLVQLFFVLADTRYVLLGVAFKSPTNPASVGRQDFPGIVINRNPSGGQQQPTESVMLVEETYGGSSTPVSFNYVILVQEVASGNIGVIDPEIETEQTEP